MESAMANATVRERDIAEDTKSAAETESRAASHAVRETSERPGGSAHEATRQASATVEAAAEAATRTGSSLAEGMQDITKAWAHYAEEVMDRTSEATRAMIGCQSLSEMFEIEAKFVRSNLEAFLDQSSKIAEIASRMATRPFEALTHAIQAGARR
jgi:hypothetical protein